MRKKSRREEVGEMDGRRQWDGEWAVKERGKKEGRNGEGRKGRRKAGKEEIGV